MSNELELLAEKEMKEAAEVIGLLSQGKTPTQINSLTGVPPRRQREIKEAWFQHLCSDRYAGERSKQLIGMADEHYSHLISEMYDVADQANSQGDYKVRKEALKEVANIEKIRIDFFQKAGIISENSLGNNLAEMHEEVERVKEVLKRLSAKFPEFRKAIAEELALMNGEVIATQVVGEDQ